MIEFYTEEFKERASKQINEINNMIKGVLPNLYKWQMKGCYLINEDYTALYRPLLDENNNQVGTDIKVLSDEASEKYLITSSKEMIRVVHNLGHNIHESYLTKLDDNTLVTQILLNYNDDFISVTINNNGTSDEININSNLDEDKIKDSLLDKGNSNILEYLRSFYYDNKSNLKRVRK